MNLSTFSFPLQKKKPVNKATNLSLEEFWKSEPVEKMLMLNFQTIISTHLHEEFTHPFPDKTTRKKIK